MLETDRKNRSYGEPTGTAESLQGKIDARQFGDRARGSTADELKEKKDKAAKRREDKRARGEADDDGFGVGKRSRNAGGKTSVLSGNESGLYKPKTRETRAAYEGLLSVLQGVFGDQPHDVMRGAADEVLAVLKEEGKTERDKQKEVEKLMGELTTERFAQMCAIGKLITDFSLPGEGGEGAGDEIDDDIGVAVEFEEEEEEEDSDVDEVLEASDADDDDQGDEGDDLNAAVGGMMGDDDYVPREDHGLNPSDIDAHWLQRCVARAFGYTDSDAAESLRLSDEVLGVLALDDARECENALVSLLDFDKFDLIKVLLKNRLKIAWCTRLARGQSAEEIADIEAQMKADPVA